MIDSFEVPKIEEEVIDKTRSKFTIEPLYPGYGATLGNALRRVILSSLSGTAISSIKLEGISHEFSAIPHVKEDMINIIMNLKKVIFISHSDEPVVIELNVKGPAEVTAADFKKSADVEIVNPDQHIATLDRSAIFDLEITIKKGRGYKPTEDKEAEKNDIGRISVDSVFSPIKLVNLTIGNTRVGQMTNYEKIELELTTNGSIAPKDAITQASKILVEHFNYIAENKTDDEEVTIKAEKEEITEIEKEKIDSKTKVEDLKLSARTINALVNAGIKTVAGFKRMSDLKLSEVKGLGKKGFDEIKELLG